MAAMKESTKAIFKYLQEHNDENLTAAEVADALGVQKRSVDGVFTAAIQRKEYGERVDAEREEADGSHTKIKLLKLNDAGMALDLDAQD